MLAYGKSDIGKVRKTNEDSYICFPPEIFLVADGMGGHVAGEIASNLCTAAVSKYLKNCPQNSNWQDMLKQAILTANALIWQTALAKKEYLGMGTTVTAVYIENETVFWGHVGDSRLYIIRNNEIKQITIDHTLIEELVKKGTITETEALAHPNRNILTRAVGVSEKIKVDTGKLSWQPKDKLLLCSDGLTNMVTEDEILKIVCSGIKSADVIVNELIERANFLGGSDNITIILLAWD